MLASSTSEGPHVKNHKIASLLNNDGDLDDTSSSSDVETSLGVNFKKPMFNLDLNSLKSSSKYEEDELVVPNSAGSSASGSNGSSPTTPLTPKKKNALKVSVKGTNSSTDEPVITLNDARVSPSAYSPRLSQMMQSKLTIIPTNLSCSANAILTPTTTNSPMAISPRSQYITHSPLSSPLGFSPHQVLVDFSHSPRTVIRQISSPPPLSYDNTPIIYQPQPSPIFHPVPNIIYSPKSYLISPRGYQYQPQFLQPHQAQQQPPHKSKPYDRIYYQGSKSRMESYQFEEIPLFIACYHNNVPSLKNMIKFDTDLNYQDKKGYTPLMLATQENNIEIVHLILESRKANINTKNLLGNSALMVACYHSRTELVDVLLRAGADPHSSNREGATALMIASANADLDIMELLHKHGANPNIVDNRGYSALMYCQIYGIKLNNGTNEMITPRPFNGVAVSEEDLDFKKQAIHLLLSFGSRIDHVSKDEFDPLKLSIKHGPLNFVQYLLDRLIDASSLLFLDSQGWSPLKLAFRYAPFPILLTLLKKIDILIASPSTFPYPIPLQYLHMACQQANQSSITINNKEQFIVQSLLFLIQCQREPEFFIKTLEYFYKMYQFQLDQTNIEMLKKYCTESTQKPIEEHLNLLLSQFEI